MRVLVIGGFGHIGTRFVQQFVHVQPSLDIFFDFLFPIFNHRYCVTLR